MTPNTQVLVEQIDRDAAADWAFIECRHCSEYEGNLKADLAEAFARHRLAAQQPDERDAEIARLTLERDEAVQALADYRNQPYAPWGRGDPDDTIGAMIDNQAWVMMSHIGSFIGYRDGDPDLMERWQEEWAENYPNLLKGWFSPHRAAAKYVADRLTIRAALGAPK